MKKLKITVEIIVEIIAITNTLQPEHVNDFEKPVNRNR